MNITRDDLCVDLEGPPDCGHESCMESRETTVRPVTDAEALRALLTDECEHGESKPHIAAQKGMAQMVWTCPGWILKDGVTLYESKVGGEHERYLTIPAQWLEAADE